MFRTARARKTARGEKSSVGCWSARSGSANESCVTSSKISTSLSLPYFSCKRNEVVTCHKKRKKRKRKVLGNGKIYKGTEHSQLSSFRANCMQVKGASFPSHWLIKQACHADLALVVPWSSFLSLQWALHQCQWAVKTFMLIPTLQCVHLPGAGLGAADTVMD